MLWVEAIVVLNLFYCMLWMYFSLMFIESKSWDTISEDTEPTLPLCTQGAVKNVVAFLYKAFQCKDNLL